MRLPALPLPFAALAFALLAMTLPSLQSAEAPLRLHLRSRDPAAGVEGKPKETSAQWKPSETAMIICDMWDDHWCKSAAQRVGELAIPMNQLVAKARAKGILIIHAPSSVTSFYNGTPQRRLAQEAAYAKTPKPLATAERWGTTWCWPDTNREKALPIDDSDMGCACPTKCTIREAWHRQIATLEIGPSDAITDHGQETFNLLQARGIKNVLIMGVHLNMCVLGRPFAIRELVHQGKNVALIRDMTDTMYDPRMKPNVDHFTGTDLVVAHVESYWCPSIESTDLTGKTPFRFKADKRKK